MARTGVPCKARQISSFSIKTHSFAYFFSGRRLKIIRPSSGLPCGSVLRSATPAIPVSLRWSVSSDFWQCALVLRVAMKVTFSVSGHYGTFRWAVGLDDLVFNGRDSTFPLPVRNFLIAYSPRYYRIESCVPRRHRTWLGIVHHIFPQSKVPYAKWRRGWSGYCRWHLLWCSRYAVTLIPGQRCC